MTPSQDHSHLEVEFDDEPIFVGIVGTPARMDVVKAEAETGGEDS